MTQARRSAPDAEWVLMYRSGIPTPKIAAVVGAAESTVRYHLAVAARQDAGLRTAHKAALSTRQRLTAPGQRNLDDILALYANEGRLPARGGTDRERALATWLQRRREEAADGDLSPIYAHALDTIPGWREQATKRDADEARWKQRLGELVAYLAAGNELPRHNKTDDQEERTLGVWLHTQRITLRAGKLTPAREKLLNETVAGWRQGRPRRGANSRR
ncbi:helicase associated domain-containing protein [Arthrobacter sedimenti]|uniref:Helicase associated domain-containing protein n=1 Tax=Arthrobacter sedimenti TaxID=2694931 RepID=A0ABV8WF23_9MICC